LKSATFTENGIPLDSKFFISSGSKRNRCLEFRLGFNDATTNLVKPFEAGDARKQTTILESGHRLMEVLEVGTLPGFPH